MSRVPISVPTLYLASALSAFTVAGVITLVWRRNPDMHALRWWSATYTLAACGIALLMLRGIAPGWASIDLANALVELAHGFLWVGACVFVGRPARPLWPVLVVVAWLIACQFEIFASSIPARTAAGTGVVVLWSVLTARELLRARSQHLPSLMPIVVLCVAHSAIFLVTGVGAVFAGGEAPDPILTPTPWFAIRSVGGYLFSIASGIALVALAKEQSERRHRTRAVTDPLTGVLNRRALFEQGGPFLRSRSERQGPVSAIVFDLDHFKSVNDRSGHPAGDDLLVLFARTAAAELRPTDLLGRIGGDEFVALVSGTAGEAKIMAEMVQTGFRQRCAESRVGGAGMPTVSAGIASHRGDEDLKALIDRADRALYLAKQRGRDRVEAATI